MPWRLPRGREACRGTDIREERAWHTACVAQSKVMTVCRTCALSSERCMSYPTGRWSPWNHWEEGRRKVDLFCSLGLVSSAGELTHELANFGLSIMPSRGIINRAITTAVPWDVQRALDVMKFYSTIGRVEMILTPRDLWTVLWGI